MSFRSSFANDVSICHDKARNVRINVFPAVPRLHDFMKKSGVAACAGFFCVLRVVHQDLSSWQG